jgi:hypothetical protein
MLFALGLTGIGYQQLTERYNLPLMVLYGLMIGVPGLAQLIVALRGVVQADTSSTESSSGARPQSESSTSSF